MANPDWLLVFKTSSPAGAAKLVEPLEDVDIDQAMASIEENLADESWMRRMLAVEMNRFGLEHGSRLVLKLHSTCERAELISQSKFGCGHSIKRVSLNGLPFFMHITTRTPSGAE